MCHLSVFESDLIKETGFRKDYDGAQDHDIILRTAGRLALEGKENEIVHISKVLYHWRCHEDSTAAKYLSSSGSPYFAKYSSKIGK